MPDQSAQPSPSAPELPAAPAAPGRWPQQPARHGEVYKADDPNFPGRQILIMCESTFLESGTIIEALRRTCLEQDARIKALVADNAVLAQRSADAETRLNNLREVRRSEKRAEIEKELILPGDTRFSQQPKGK